jgi:hypothetical protein
MTFTSRGLVGAPFRHVRPEPGGLLLALALLVATSIPERPAPAEAQTAPGHVLASTRGQVAWLDLVAPRPTPLTQLVRPTYPADVDAVSGVPFAVASVVGALGANGGFGGDLVLLDLQSGVASTLLAPSQTPNRWTCLPSGLTATLSFSSARTCVSPGR